MHRLALLALACLAIIAAWLFLAPNLRANSPAELAALLSGKAAARPILAAVVFVALYTCVTGLALPFAVPLSLVAGAVFGRFTGTLLVLVAATLGASLAFLAARFLLRDFIASRLGPRLSALEDGLSRGGARYLFALRLIPLVPFTAINLGMGLTRMRLATFAGVTLVGIAPGTFALVNAGSELAHVGSLRDVLSPALWGAIALLALLPFAFSALQRRLAARRALRGFTRPAKFDRNLIVIGAGSAGLVATYIARTLRAEVTLVEGNQMGGDCLNTGCVPSKALIHAAETIHRAREAAALGLTISGKVDLAQVMAHLKGAIATIAPHDSVARYQGEMGAEVLIGHATVVDPWTVRVATADGATVQRSARAIVIASGAEPILPDLPGLTIPLCTSDTLWDHLSQLSTLPRRILILGGGPIGCELAQAFARLGAEVTLVQRNARLLPREEEEASALIAGQLTREGVRVFCGHEVKEATGDSVRIGDSDHTFDLVLAALGRRARISGFGLESLGLTAAPRLESDSAQQTAIPTIFAAGDVTSSLQFTHVAADQAVRASLNALASGFWRLRAKDVVIPRVTFTDPEIASVGLTRAEAKDRDLRVTDFPLGRLDRAVTEGRTEGFVRLLTDGRRNRLVGVTIAAPRAGEMIAEFALAMRKGLSAGDILRTVHAYPTWGEAGKLAAGRLAQGGLTPSRAALLERFMRWRRG